MRRVDEVLYVTCNLCGREVAIHEWSSHNRAMHTRRPRRESLTEHARRRPDTPHLRLVKSPEGE